MPRSLDLRCMSHAEKDALIPRLLPLSGQLEAALARIAVLEAPDRVVEQTRQEVYDRIELLPIKPDVTRVHSLRPSAARYPICRRVWRHRLYRAAEMAGAGDGDRSAQARSERHDVAAVSRRPRSPTRPRNGGHPERPQRRHRIARHRAHLFEFTTNRNVPATNNISERHLRRSVIFRKVTNGFRSELSAATHAAFRSVVSTATREGIVVLNAIRKALVRERECAPG